jgi:hypothetical protein
VIKSLLEDCLTSGLLCARALSKSWDICMIHDVSPHGASVGSGDTFRTALDGCDCCSRPPRCPAISANAGSFTVYKSASTTSASSLLLIRPCVNESHGTLRVVNVVRRLYSISFRRVLHRCQLVIDTWHMSTMQGAGRHVCKARSARLAIRGLYERKNQKQIWSTSQANPLEGSNSCLLHARFWFTPTNSLHVLQETIPDQSTESYRQAHTLEVRAKIQVFNLAASGCPVNEAACKSQHRTNP